MTRKPKQTPPQDPNADAHLDTRNRLLKAAVLCFANKGFEGAGIREIAQMASANSALVQYYFGNKEGLYRASLNFLFEQSCRAVQKLEPLPSDRTQTEAAAHLQAYIRAFLEELFVYQNDTQAPEFRAAGQIFWTRELLHPDQERANLVLDYIRPYVENLTACLRVLRPDLSESERFLHGCSIQAQILFFYRDTGVLAKVRGKPFGPEDLETLVAHITQFSLRGLDLAHLITQGA